MQIFNQETFLTRDGQPSGRNNDEISHWLTNSTERSRLNRTDLEINTACRAPHDDSMQKFNPETFFDHGWTTHWTKQRRSTTPTATIEKLLQEKHIVTTVNL